LGFSHSAITIHKKAIIRASRTVANTTGYWVVNSGIGLPVITKQPDL